MTRAAHGTDLSWFKSSYSSDQGGDCVEVAYDWRKSSYSASGDCIEIAYDWHKSSHSSDQGGACVEVSAHPAAVHIRDSKVTDGPVLTVPPAAWAAFVASAV
ncbi:DUF397 domain-containing protein [Streptomyces sp. NPDC058411]|uniref:DUF397 domain-containing protein n=1 Tax=Streptomyces sp. NPDC058411 TaxID=3346485 RepID=UPI003646BA9B